MVSRYKCHRALVVSRAVVEIIKKRRLNRVKQMDDIINFWFVHASLWSALIPKCNEIDFSRLKWFERNKSTSEKLGRELLPASADSQTPKIKDGSDHLLISFFVGLIKKKSQIHFKLRPNGPSWKRNLSQERSMIVQRHASTSFKHCWKTNELFH